MKVKIENCPAICSVVIVSSNSTSRLRASDDQVDRSTGAPNRPRGIRHTSNARLMQLNMPTHA